MLLKTFQKSVSQTKRKQKLKDRAENGHKKAEILEISHCPSREQGLPSTDSRTQAEDGT